MMVREIVVWCSQCLLGSEERVPATSLTVAFDGKKPRSLDLCDDCLKRFVTPLAELLDEYGNRDAMPAPRATPAPARRAAPVAAPRPAISTSTRVPAGRVECLVCGTVVDKNGESTHYKMRHKTSKGRVLIERGEGEGLEECPATRCEYVATSAQGLGMHIARTNDPAHTGYRAKHPAQR